ncbi:MAG: S8 family serine peptidase [Planctomycetota bacterium]
MGKESGVGSPTVQALRIDVILQRDVAGTLWGAARRASLWVILVASLTTRSGRAQDLDFVRPSREESPFVAPFVEWGLLERAANAGVQELITAIAIESEAGLDEGVFRTFGGELLDRARGLARVRLPAGRLREIAAGVPGLTFLRLPLTPLELTESEGVWLTAADRYHATGTTGEGIGIGIIDLGFAGLTDAIDIGELPSDIERVNFSSSDLESTTYHGTAVAEVIHDMAPGARLHAIKVDDEVSLARAADYCISHEIRVINHSVAWFNTNYYDGTGYVCSVARNAVQHGIAWVNAAGNSAQRHWEGPLIDADGDGLCEFRTADESIDIVAYYGSPVRIALTWDDWSKRKTDLDLFLFDDSGTVVASSRNSQGSGQEPTEFVSYDVESTGRFTIAVSHEGGPAAVDLEIYSFYHDVEPALRVESSSLVSPADAREVIAVGAVRSSEYDRGPQEPFSSQGPSNAGLAKPDLMGPDAVSNATYGYFSGTSAASPHVAGALALLLARDPSRRLEDVREALFELAQPFGDPLVFGYGAAMLADEAPPAPIPAFEREPEAVSPYRISMRASTVSDPSSVEYAFAGVGAAPGRTFGPSRDFVAEGLLPNTEYAFKPRARDLSPLANEASPGRARAARTHIETPAGVSLEVLAPRRIAARIQGTFTNLSEGAAALRLEVEGPGAPDSRWGRERSQVIEELRPNSAYRFFARARNAGGVPTARSGPFAAVTRAEIPPAPRLESVRGTVLELTLDAGANPPGTELALFNATRRTFVRPSGLEALVPVFAPAESWRNISLRELAPLTSYAFAAMARNGEGVLTRFSPILVAETGEAVALPPPPDGATHRQVDDGTPASEGSLVYWSEEGRGGPAALSLKLLEVAASEVELLLEGDLARQVENDLTLLLHREGGGPSVTRKLESTHVVDAVSPNETYVYQARLLRGEAVVGESALLRVVTAAILPEPVQVSVEQDGVVRAAVPQAVGWRALSWQVIEGDSVVQESGWRNEPSMDFHGLEAGRSYLVQVRACNRAGVPTGWSRPVALEVPAALSDEVSGRSETPVASGRSGASEKAGATELVEAPVARPTDVPVAGLLEGAREEESPALATARAASQSAPTAKVAGDAHAATRDGRRGRPTQEREWHHRRPLGPEVLSPSEVALFFGGEHAQSALANALLERWDGETAVLQRVEKGEAHVSGLQPNTAYTFRLKGVPEVVDGMESRIPGPWTVYTAIETPEGLELLERGASSVVLRVRGPLSHLDSGLSGLILEEQTGNGRACGGVSALQGWTGRRTLRVAGLRPDTLYRFSVRARNGSGLETASSPLLEVRTLPAPPHAPRVEAVEHTAVALRLDAPDNPAETELCLEDLTRGAFISPQGRSSPRPVFAPAAEWRHIVVRGLEPGSSLVLRARTRSANGELGPCGPETLVRTAGS